MSKHKSNSIAGRVDSFEFSVIGTFSKDSLLHLRSLELRKHRLAGKVIEICEGGKDGPDFYDIAIMREEMFRIHVYKKSINGFGVRVICYSGLLSRYGLKRSKRIVRNFLRDIGFHWKRHQVSRIDLCVDLPVPWEDFRQRIDLRQFVCRAKKLAFNKYPSTLYFGEAKSIQAKIYDKALQRGEDRILTRVEFSLRRKWLRANKLHKVNQLDLEELWKRLTTEWLRITKRKPDGKHYNLEIWHVWEQVQQCRDFRGELERTAVAAKT